MPSEDPNITVAAMTPRRNLWRRGAVPAGGGSVRGGAAGRGVVERKQGPQADRLEGVVEDLARLEEG